MKRNRMSKLSASLIVLAMAVSALVLLPSDGGTGQTVKTNVIEVPVQDTLGFFVSGATVDLTNVHTGAAIRATLTTPGLYHADNVPAGIYRLDVVNGDSYDNHTVMVNFTAYSSLVTPTVLLKAFEPKSFTWTVTVNKAVDGTALTGATVGFFDCRKNETVVSASSNATGVAVLPMFGTQPADKFVLYAKATGYNTTFEEMVVSSDGSRTWSLDISKRVTGYVKNSGGTSLLNNVVGYMISNDTNLPQIARVLKSVDNGKFQFDAFPGDFVMVVDADGGSAYVNSIRISASDSYSFDDFRLDDQARRTEQLSVVFGDDYQNFSLSVDTNWSYDEAHPCLLFGDIGSLRMQVDLAVGDGNGILSQSEIDRFDRVLGRIGSQYVTSSGLIQVNDSLFDPGSVTGYTMDLAPGSVISKTMVHYAYSVLYLKHGTVEIGLKDYPVNLTARYDSYEVDYKYNVTPPSSFELVSNESSSLVTVMGYAVVSIDPSFVASGGQEPVEMTLEESVPPIAKAALLDTASSYAVIVDKNVTHYVVAVGENVTLTAVDSSDQNDPLKKALRYYWNFGDGSFENTTSVTVVHKFATSASFTVNLTVFDAVNLENWSEITVLGDNIGPTPVITVKDKTVVSNTIAVNQREVVWFNATGSGDSAVVPGDNKGVIDRFVFDWGDLNSSSVIYWTADQQNVSASWERSGTYTVTLNVTDVVGHWTNTTMTVKVNDTQAPTVTFVVRNETWQSSYIENKTLSLDANGTVDNVDARDKLNFSWEFDDGSWLNQTGAEGGWNVTHTFASTGDFNIMLNVTDLSGNFKVERRLITVLPGPRPDLYVESVKYDPKNFTEGRSGLILVNVTNKGSVDASNLQISLYIVAGDGTQKPITGTGTLWVNDTQVLVVKPGETVQYRLPYSPGSKGTFTVRVNVTCDNMLRPFSYTTGTSEQMHVKQAAWVQWALWGGVLAIVVILPLLLLFRGRLVKREKKGPRRERKEKEREKSSDEEL